MDFSLESVLKNFVNDFIPKESYDPLWKKSTKNRLKAGFYPVGKRRYTNGDLRTCIRGGYTDLYDFVLKKCKNVLNHSLAWAAIEGGQLYFVKKLYGWNGWNGWNSFSLLRHITMDTDLESIKYITEMDRTRTWEERTKLPPDCKKEIKDYLIENFGDIVY